MSKRSFNSDSMLLTARDAREWIIAWRNEPGYARHLARVTADTADRIRYAHQRRAIGDQLPGVRACLAVFERRLAALEQRDRRNRLDS